MLIKCTIFEIKNRIEIQNVILNVVNDVKYSKKGNLKLKKVN